LTSIGLNPLKPGDRIALVAPSSPFPVDKFNSACEMLKEKGYEVSAGRHIFNARKYLSAPDAERAQDLIDAVSDPGVSTIICVRGGYGGGRLLPWLPLSSFRRHPKIFLGYSDVTFLHLGFWGRVPWATFHGPNLIELADDAKLADDTLESLAGARSFAWALREEDILRHGTAAGRLAGGNLSCLVHLIGTPFFPNLDGAILLLEDRGESLYRLDRYLTQVRLAGIFQRLRGLVLGRFTECGEEQDVYDMIMEQVKLFQFPVLGNLPFCHGRENQVIPLGATFVIDTRDKVFRIAQSPFNE
jgi:muramoyltetrapeptide carboxypeptidase